MMKTRTTQTVSVNNARGQESAKVKAARSGRFYRVLLAGVVCAVLAMIATPNTTMAAKTTYWQGGTDGKWSTAANWSLGVPVNNDLIYWDASSTGNKISTNDISSLSVVRINLLGAPDGIVLNGNPLTLTSGGNTAPLGAGKATVNMDLTLTGSAPRLNSASTDECVVNGVVSHTSASEAINAAYGGKLTLNGLNTFEGTCIVGASGSATLYINTLKNSTVAQSTGKGSLIQFGPTSSLIYVGEGDSTQKGFKLGLEDTSVTAGGFYNNGCGAVTWSGAQTLASTAAARTFTLGGFNGDNNTWQSAVVNNNSYSIKLQKDGSGKWILTGANTFTGGLAINSGTLLLDYASNPSVVDSANNVTLAGGTLELKGKSGGAAQTVGTVTTTASTGLSIVKITQSGSDVMNLTNGAHTINANAPMLYDLNGSANSSVTIGTARTTPVGGLLIRTSAGAVDYAINTGANTPIFALNAGTALPAGANSALDYILTGSQTLTASAPQVRTLRIAPSSGGQSLTLNPSTSTANFVIGTSLTGGSILFVGDYDFTINQTGNGAIAGGTAANDDAVIHHFGGGKLTLNVKLASNSTGGDTGATVGLFGTGLIDWMARANGAGDVVIGGVTVRVNSSGGPLLSNTGTGSGSGNIVLTGGGVIELNGADITRNVGTGAGAIQWKGDGGFSAYGANCAIQLNNGVANVDWTATGFVPTNNALVLSSSTSGYTIDFQNPLNFGSQQRLVRVNNGSAAVDAKFSGVLSSSGLGGGLVKEGAGTLELTADNTYNGATWVKAGELKVSGSLGAGVQGTANGGLVTVFSGAMLSGGGTVDKLTLNSGSTLRHSGSGSGLTVRNALNLPSSGTVSVTVDSTPVGPVTLISAGSAISNTNSLSLPVGYTLTMTGNTLTLNPPSAAGRTASQTGDWNNTATWGGAAVPTSTEAVTINAGVTVTVPSGVAAQCSAMTFTTGSGASSINLADSSASLAVVGAVTIPRNGSAANAIDVGAGTFTAGSVALQGTSGGTQISKISIGTGTATISGDITSAGADSQIVFTGAGTLNAGGTFLSGTAGTLTLATGCTVNYNKAGAQTVGAYTYKNLTLSGSGAKTLTGVTIDGVLSMEGTATATVAPTYGSSATLQYNTAIARTAGPEWITPFAAGGGILVKNTGTVTLNENKSLNASVPLNIQSGSALDASAGNYALTGSGAVTIAGTLNLRTATTHACATLSLGGLGRINGTWGSSSASSATYQNNTYFSATTGYLTAANDNRATPAVSTWPTASAIAYGSALSASTLSGGSASVGGLFAFTNPGTVPPGGTNPQDVTFTPTDLTSYKTVAGTVNVTVLGGNTRTATVSGDWNQTATWNGESVPGLGDFAIIGAGVTVTVPAGYSALCATLDFTTGSGASLVEFADGTASLAVSGAVTIQRNGSAVNAINVGAGTFSAASVALQGTTGGTQLSKLTVGTGSATISGSITSAGADSQVVFTGAGTLKVGGALLGGTSGTLVPSTGTVEYNAAGAQTVGAYTYNNLTLSGSGIKTMTGVTAVNGNLTVSGTATMGNAGGLTIGGTFNYGSTSGTTTLAGNVNGVGLTISGSGGTLDLGSGLTHTFSGDWTRTAGTLNGGSITLKIAGAVSGSGGTFTCGTGTVEWNGGAQTIADVSYYSLTLSGSGTKTIPAGVTSIGGNLTLSGAATASTPANLAITGNLNVGSGTALTIAPNFTLGVTGTTTVGGTLTLNSTGAKTFTGNVTISPGGVWNESANSTYSFGGNLQVEGSAFTANGGIHTFTGTGKTLGGSLGISISNVTVNGTYVNNGTLTVNTALAGSGTLTQGANATLNFNGTSVGINTLDASGSENTVNYSRAGSTTIKAVNYYNLTVSGGSGALKTLGGNINIAGDLTVSSGTLDLSTYTADRMTSGGTLYVAAGATMAIQATSYFPANYGTLTLDPASTVDYKASGDQTVAVKSYGNLTLSGSGVKTMTGVTTVNGDVTVSGTATMAGAGGLTIGGTLDYTSTSGTSILAGNVIGIGLTINGTGGTLDLGAGHTHTFSGTWTRTAGTLNGGSSTLRLGAPLNTVVSGSGGTFTANAGTVELYASGSQTVPNLTYNNLTLSGSGAKTLLASMASIGGNLTLSGTATATTQAALTIGGKLNVGAGTTLTEDAYDLTVNGTTIVSGVLTHGKSAGTMTLTGDVTINNGGTLSQANSTTGPFVYGGNVTLASGGALTEKSTATMSCAGNFENNGTYTASTGIHTFSGTGKTIGGTMENVIPSVTISGSYVNNGTLSVNTDLAGGGTLTQGASASSILKLGGTVNSAVLSASGSGNTVNYTRAGAQTVAGVAYHHLTLSGSGAKDISGVSSIGGNLTVSGSATMANSVATTLAGSLNYGSSGTSQLGGNLAIGGDLAITAGTLDLAAYTADRASSGGILSLAAGTSLLVGGMGNFPANYGTVTLNASSTVNYNRAGDQTVAVKNYGILTLSGSGAKTMTGVASVAGNLNVSGTATMADAGGLTIGGTLNYTSTSGTSTLTGNVTGAALTINGLGGTLNLGSGLTHTFSGNWTRTAGTVEGGSSTLRIGGDITVAVDFTFNVGTSTVELYATGNQSFTPRSTAHFYNLTLSGSGIKTASFFTTIDGDLTVADGVVFSIASTYSLQVDGATTVGVGGRMTLASTGGKTFTSDVTLNAGSIWDESGVSTYSFGGNLLVNGTTFNANTGIHTFSGVGKTIGGTLAISIPNVTISGSYMNNGALTVGTALVFGNSKSLVQGATASSILTLGGAVSGTGSWTLDATGNGNKVIYSGSAQAMKGTTYHHLTLSGSGTKTTTGFTVNGVLSLEGTATPSVAPTYGANATLQYNTDTARTADSEWITPFVATGGVLIKNTGAITLNGSKSFNASVPLTIQSGATLDASASNYALTCNGGLAIDGLLNLRAATTHTASRLAMGGLGKVTGTWGSNSSPATHKNGTYFAPTAGYLTVATDTRADSFLASLLVASSITEGQSLSASVLTGGSATNITGASVSGTFGFTTPGVIPAVGTAAHNVMFTPSDLDSYKTFSTTVNVTVLAIQGSIYSIR